MPLYNAYILYMYARESTEFWESWTQQIDKTNNNIELLDHTMQAEVSKNEHTESN